MTQKQLERAVAIATGESCREIRRRGFSIVRPDDQHFDPEPDERHPLAFDWDYFYYHQQRNSAQNIDASMQLV